MAFYNFNKNKTTYDYNIKLTSVVDVGRFAYGKLTTVDGDYVELPDHVSPEQAVELAMINIADDLGVDVRSTEFDRLRELFDKVEISYTGQHRARFE